MQLLLERVTHQLSGDLPKNLPKIDGFGSFIKILIRTVFLGSKPTIATNDMSFEGLLTRSKIFKKIEKLTQFRYGLRSLLMNAWPDCNAQSWTEECCAHILKLGFPNIPIYSQ